MKPAINAAWYSQLLSADGQEVHHCLPLLALQVLRKAAANVLYLSAAVASGLFSGSSCQHVRNMLACGTILLCRRVFIPASEVLLKTYR